MWELLRTEAPYVRFVGIGVRVNHPGTLLGYALGSALGLRCAGLRVMAKALRRLVIVCHDSIENERIHGVDYIKQRNTHT